MLTLSKNRMVASWSALGHPSLAIAPVRSPKFGIISLVAGAIALCSCATGYQPTQSASRRPSPARDSLFFAPPPGKSQFVFSNDRIECAYAVKPWTPQGFAACMIARGNLVFEWSSTKSQAELQNDKLECARSVVHKLTDEGEREFEACLQVRGDLLVASGQQGLPSSGAQMQAYVVPRQGPPANTCSNFARGNSALFSQCMDHQRSYSQTYCLDATNRREAEYIQCMAGRGFTVAGLPGGYGNISPSGEQALQSPSTTQLEGSGGITPSAGPHNWIFTEEQKKRFAADLFVQSGKAYVYCRKEDHPWRCAAVSVVKGMAPDEREAICTDPDLLHDYLHIQDELQQTIVQLLRCSA